MEDNQGKNEVESTLRFNSEWLTEENQSLSPEHQAAVDALPERHAARDTRGLWFRCGVVPRGVGIVVPVGGHGVVGGQPLPPAGRGGDARPDVPGLDGLGGEVVVAFDDDGVIALGDDRALPDGFHTL